MNFNKILFAYTEKLGSEHVQHCAGGGRYIYLEKAWREAKDPDLLHRDLDWREWW